MSVALYIYILAPPNNGEESFEAFLLACLSSFVFKVWHSDFYKDSNRPRLIIGHGLGVVINASARIGKNVSLSQFLTVGSNKGKAATIEDDVYIAPSVCLAEDVVIGRGSVVGAGSVVTEDVPPQSIVVGVPAKIIKRYNPVSQQWEKV